MKRETTRVTLTIEETHECGQVFEQCVTLVLDDLFSYTLRSEPVSMETMGLSDDLFRVPILGRPSIELKSHYGKVEIHGIELKEHQFLCKTCGEDVFFPHQKERVSEK